MDRGASGSLDYHRTLMNLLPPKCHWYSAECLKFARSVSGYTVHLRMKQHPRRCVAEEVIYPPGFTAVSGLKLLAIYHKECVPEIALSSQLS